MKINPLSVVLDERLCLKYKCFFVSGNEESYIFSIKETITKVFLKEGYLRKNDVDNLNGALFDFGKKSLYVFDKIISEELINNIESNGDSVIMCEKSSKKNKFAKTPFIKNQNRALIECYELEYANKKIILDSFINKNQLSIDNDNYFFLLDILDNKFAILKNDLEKLSLLKQIGDFNQLKFALSNNGPKDISKIFFKFMLNRSDLIKYIHTSISSLSDFHEYFFNIKLYSLLLINSSSKQELNRGIPIYLFKEKNFFMELYDSLDQNKKKLLTLLLYKTEFLTRKNPNLYKSICFRFTLQFKKIIF